MLDKSLYWKKGTFLTRLQCAVPLPGNWTLAYISQNANIIIYKPSAKCLMF